MKLKSIRLRNWKAFKDCTVELNPSLNVLVGPNASGKTSLLEAFKFLKKALGEITSPYAPHLEWWSYRNIVYGNDETQPITFELTFECPENYTAKYEVTFLNIEGTVKPYRETIELEGVVKIIKEGERITIAKNRDYLRQHEDDVRNEIFNRIKRYGVKLETILRETETGLVPRAVISLLGFLEREPWMWLHYGPWTLMTGEKLALTRIWLTEYETTLYEERIKRKTAYLVAPFLESVNEPLFKYVVDRLDKFFRKILFIRHLDMGKVREPSVFSGQPTPSERGENIALIIANMTLKGAGRLPEPIEESIKNLYPNFTLRPQITTDGRVFISIYDALYGAEIHPPSIPDGFYKLLHILSAVESNPSILLIDELENSLHSELLEYIIHELKNAEIQSIAATHSPIVVDVAGLENLILLERTPEGSIAKRVENIEEVKKWMKEKGLTPSEMWLYGLS